MAGRDGVRTSPHTGCTALESNDSIKVLYDAEIEDIRWCLKMRLCLWGCKEFDRERSYLYVRENSLETNLATTCICCADWTDDTTKVLYFDRAPFKPSTIRCCFVPFPCCGKTDPKLEVSETGCWCCCQRIVCCDRVVIMPYESCPFPLCWFKPHKPQHLQLLGVLQVQWWPCGLSKDIGLLLASA